MPEFIRTFYAKVLACATPTFWSLLMDPHNFSAAVASVVLYASSKRTANAQGSLISSDHELTSSRSHN
jgi:hypothetical protein